MALLGAEIGPPGTEADVYYAHPARDFAATDEALRIRRADKGCFITYKGPKIDAASKTRREIDLPLAAGNAGSWADLLAALGFTPVAEVRKSRRKAHVLWQGREVEVSLDEIAGLGQFVELELVADQEGLEAAKACIAALAQRLRLVADERRSYLELLLATKR